MSQFYLTLPSNTPLDDHPIVGRQKRFATSKTQWNLVSRAPVEDTFYEADYNESSKQVLGKYRVQLPQKVSLEGDWEVALSEIMYPHSWFNINKSDAIVRVTYSPGNQKIIVSSELFPNQYSDADQLVKALNFNHDNALGDRILNGSLTSAEVMNYKISFIYQKELRRIIVKAADPEIIEEFYMSPHLAYVLGFDNPVMFLTPSGVYKSWVMAEYPVDLRGGFYAMFVYCDLVANQIVGNSLVPLLRTVTIEGNHEDVVCNIYNTPHYIPLARKEFDSVEISINDDQNKPVKFQFGKLIVKLAFRRQKPERF